VDTEPGTSPSLDTDELAEAADGLARKIAGDRSLAEVAFTPSLEEILDRASGCLVVTGPWGVGKTLLVQQFELASLARRDPGAPVAVRVGAETWHAGTSLENWLSELLRTTYSVESPMAEALVEARLLHPLVDDVDELAAGLRREFLDAVRAAPYPILLASRPGEFLQGLPALELQPPSLHARLHRWPAIADAVSADPGGPVGVALADDVNRYALGWVYQDDGTDSSVLVDRAQFPDSESVERHLLAELAPERLRLLRALAHWARTVGEGKIAWWRLAESAPRAGLVAVAVTIAVLGSIVAALSGTAVLEFVVHRPLPTWARAVPGAVALMALLVSLLSLRRPGRPVAFELDRWRRASATWLAAGTGTGVVTGVAVLVLGGHLANSLGAVVAGAAVGALGALATLVVVRDDDDRLDDPVQVLRQDRTVLLARVVGALVVMISVLTAMLGEEAFNNSDVGLLTVLTGVPMVARSAYARYKLAGWLPTSARFDADDAVGALSAVPQLIRREGGFFEFRDESVRRRLADSEFERVDLLSSGSAPEQVAEMRHQLAAQACEKAGFTAVLEQNRLQGFVDDVASDIKRNVNAIHAASTAAWRNYVTAKAHYTEVLLKIPLETSVSVTAVTPFLPLSGSAALVFAATGEVVHRAGLTWLSAAAVVFGSTLLATLTVRASRATSGWAPHDIAAGMVLGSTVRLALAFVDRLEPLHLSVWDVVVLVAGAGSWVFWAATVRLWSLTTALRSDDPNRWPAEKKPGRAVAVQARHDWIQAVLDRGVRPLVAARLAEEAKRSYGKVLPTADVRGLGDVTDVGQYVPTETNSKLLRMMESMAHGAIGISGPRGVGKSTVLKMFGELAPPPDLALLVPAPTNYASRDFLVHLYAKLCTKVIGQVEAPRPRRRAWPWLVASLAGAVAAVAAWQWPQLVRAAAWVPPNWRMVVMAGGAALAVLPLVILWRRTVTAHRYPHSGVREDAQQRLDGLRFVPTTTVTHNLTVKPPAVAEFGGSRALARAAQVKTFPELVDEFRDFLARLTEDRSGARVVVCIDELDKIASAPEAERFLNDIKAIFGVRRCFFLVAVSDDALAKFSQRSLAVRTAFDSAFDNVVTVKRFELKDTRLLLVQRMSRLPEPFIWLCHALSGGLGRDLNRTVRELYDLYKSLDERNLDALARELVRLDLAAVTDGLSARLADRFDGYAVRLRQHIVNVGRLDTTSAAFIGYKPMREEAGAPDDLVLVYIQFRCYLSYAAAVLRAFGERADAVIAELTGTEADPIEFLASARVWLAADPVAAAAFVEDWTKFEDRAVRDHQLR